MNFRIRQQLLLFGLFLSPFALVAQDEALGNWLIYFGNYEVNERWYVHHEVQYRNYNSIGNLEQLLLRTGVGYNLSSGNDNILLGYGYVLSEPDRKVEAARQVHEHRIYQQFLTVQKRRGIQWQHRYRFEQRWIEDDFRLRFRYFLSFHIPLQKRTSYPYVSVYNEIFLQPETEVFDRNRLYFGMGYNWGTQIKVEAGYMNQFFTEAGRDQLNLILFLTF
ncbi:MAG: DUF2490 domain-containing protein [Bacteroidetes bacterium]|jgi:hypothetical protein|nr:DUF2490 domain-containing protein [Bacteroidota bacterium]